MDWQPIATVPSDKPVELATFPAISGKHVANITIGSDLRSAYPNATHWRDITPETAAALSRGWGDGLALVAQR